VKEKEQEEGGEEGAAAGGGGEGEKNCKFKYDLPVKV
jgi:hypothetical protein